MSTKVSVEMSPSESECKANCTSRNEPKGRKTSKRTLLALISCIFLILLTSLLTTGLYIHKEKLNQQLTERRQFIRQMTRDAWLSMLNTSGEDPDFGKIESLSSLWIMDLKEEFAQGRKWAEEWLERKFLQTDHRKVDLNLILLHIYYGNLMNFDVLPPSVQRILSSLLSCYALTNDLMFIQRAEMMAQTLKPAFEGDGLPHKNLPYLPNEHSQAYSLRDQVREGSLIKYVGGQHLEWRYFSDLTEAGQPSASRFWANKLQHIRQNISSSRTAAGLYPVNLPHVYQNEQGRVSLEEDAYGFYSYLLKSFIQSNGTDIEGLQLFFEALVAAEKEGLLTRTATGLVYTRDKHLDLGTFEQEMNYGGCNWGAILGLAASTLRKPLPPLLAKYAQEADRLEQLARDIVETCQLAAQKRKEGLVPNQMYFNHKGILSVKETDSIYLSPEMAESLFVLWRITSDSLYREYAWEMVQGLQQAIASTIRHPRDSAYANVNSNTYYRDPSLIGGTFKYLYLIFADDDALPLEHWVFNVVGQPLPVCGSTASYRKCS